MTVQHNAITDPDIHEPKGAASAASGKVYKADGTGSGAWEYPVIGQDSANASDVFVSDGAGSGTWQKIHRHLGLYIPFNATTPNYSISTGTADQRLDIPFVTAENNGFTVQTTPSTLITYTGSEAIEGFLTISFATKHQGGTSRDIQWTIFKNGTELPGARVIRTVASSSWGSITLQSNTPIQTNDYFQIYSKSSGVEVVDYASMYLTIIGVSA